MTRKGREKGDFYGTRKINVNTKKPLGRAKAEGAEEKSICKGSPKKKTVPNHELTGLRAGGT